MAGVANGLISVNQPILGGFAGFGQSDVFRQESKPQLAVAQAVAPDYLARLRAFMVEQGGVPGPASGRRGLGM
jgi:hypothetical protein